MVLKATWFYDDMEASKSFLIDCARSMFFYEFEHPELCEAFYQLGIAYSML